MSIINKISDFSKENPDAMEPLLYMGIVTVCAVGFTCGLGIYSNYLNKTFDEFVKVSDIVVSSYMK